MKWVLRGETSGKELVVNYGTAGGRRCYRRFLQAWVARSLLALRERVRTSAPGSRARRLGVRAGRLKL